MENHSGSDRLDFKAIFLTVTFYVLLLFGTFGLLYNAVNANLDQKYLHVAFFDMVLLCWTSLISYPFLIFVTFAEIKMRKVFWNISALEWWFGFLFAPVVFVAADLAFKFLNLIWSS